jgi:hypothetical protein
MCSRWLFNEWNMFPIALIPDKMRGAGGVKTQGWDETDSGKFVGGLRGWHFYSCV